MAGGLMLALAGQMAACSSTAEYAVTGNERAAGVDGTITISEGDQTNVVEIELNHLPPPERLSKGMKQYVVWFEGKGAAAVKAGNLAYDVSDRSGKMRATTPYRQVVVKISAEASDNAGAPSEVVVMTKQVKLND